MNVVLEVAAAEQAAVPDRCNEPPRPSGGGLLRAVRQLIEPVNDTFKGRLGLERHGG